MVHSLAHCNVVVRRTVHCTTPHNHNAVRLARFLKLPISQITVVLLPFSLASESLLAAAIIYSCPSLAVLLRKVSCLREMTVLLNLVEKLTLLHQHGTQFVEVILVHMHGPQLLRRGINKRDWCQLSICNCINGATPFCVVKIERPTLSQFLYSFLLGSGTQQLDAILK